MGVTSTLHAQLLSKGFSNGVVRFRLSILFYSKYILVLTAGCFLPDNSCNSYVNSISISR